MNQTMQQPCVTPGFTATAFEPVDEYKGDLARAQLYIAARYNNLIAAWVSNGTANDILAGNAYPAYDAWFLNLLIKWHNQDPPSVKEINRNNAVFAVQGNRNPFIDSPQYVNRIWGLNKPSEPATASTVLSADSIGLTGIKLSWKSGDGDRRILIAKATSSVNLLPLDSNQYSSSSIFGSGAHLGSGNYVVYDGMGSEARISGLTPSQNYFFTLLEYNGLNRTANYLSSSVASFSLISNKIDTIITCGDSTILTADSGYSTYLWKYLSKTSRTIKVGSSGWYPYTASSVTSSLNDSIFLVLLNANITKEDTAACNTESLNFSVSSSAGVSVVWSNGATTNATTFSMNPLLTGVPDNGDNPDDVNVITYPFRKKFWVRLSYLGKVCSDTAYVNVYEPPSVYFPDTIFSVGVDSVLLSGPGSLSNYSWNNGSSQRNIWVKQSGTYTLSAFQSYGCIGTDSVKLILLKGFSTDTIVTCGDSMILTADAGASAYLWNTNLTNRSITVKSNGWYTCRYTMGSFQLKDSIYVIVNGIKSTTISASGATTVCAGKAVNLQTTSSPGMNYQWQLNGANISSAISNNYSAISSGNYRLISTSVNACKDTSNQIFVQVNLPSSATSIPNGSFIFTGQVNSDFNQNTNWLTYQSSTASFINSATVPSAFSNIIIPTLGACVLSQPILTDSVHIGNMSVENGAFISLNQFKLSIHGNLSGPGRIKGKGSLIFTDTGSIATLIMHDLNDTLDQLIFDRAASLLNLGDTLKIESFVNPIAGQINSNAFLVLLSGQNKTAGILKGTVNGNVTVQRFIPGSSGRRYRYLAAPFSNGPSIVSSWQKQIHITGNGIGGTICPTLTSNSNGFDATLSNAPSFFTFNETSAINTNTQGNGGGGTLYQNAWISIPGTNNTNLLSGKGYRVFVRGNRLQGCNLLNGNNPIPQDVVLSATGIIQSGVFNFPVTYSPANGEGWNLVGNPYPCAIDWNASGAWQRINVDNHIWIYRPAGNHFATFNGALNLGVNFGSNIIESGASFFVKANAANPALQVNENAKVGLLPPVRLFKKSNSVLRAIFSKPGEAQDEFLISMLNESNDATDPYDSEKMLNPSINIFTMIDDSFKLAINSFPVVESEKEVKLGFQSNFSGTHVLSFKSIEDFSNYDVLLWDKYLGVIQLVNDCPIYSFSNTGTSLSTNRFLLIFLNRGSGDYFKLKQSLQSKLISEFIITPNPAHESISIQDAIISLNDCTYRIYNSSFQQLSSGKIKSGSNEIDIHFLSEGMYILEIFDSKGKIQRAKFLKI